MRAPRITLVLLAALAGVFSTARNRSEGTRIVVVPKATAHVFWQAVLPERVRRARRATWRSNG